MAKINVLWTKFAENCLDEVYEYVVEQTYSAELAKKVVLSIIKSTDQLRKFPNSGNLEPLLRKFKKNHRYLIIGNYKIIYQYDGINTVIITDVFHTSQNPVKIGRKKGR